MRRSDCRDCRERPVAAGHPGRIRAIGHDLQDTCPHLVGRALTIQEAASGKVGPALQALAVSVRGAVDC